MNKKKDSRIDFFDRQAPTWDDAELSADKMIAAVSQADDKLDFQSGQDVLEVGCGTGKLTPWIVDRIAPGKVHAVDFSSEMIRIAEGKGYPAAFECLDVCSQPLEKNAYDVVFCFHVFPHLRDQPGALQNFAGALREDGKLIVMHLRGSEQINAFHAQVGCEVGCDHLPVGKDEWEPLLESAGFELKYLTDSEDGFLLIAE